MKIQFYLANNLHNIEVGPLKIQLNHSNHLSAIYFDYYSFYKISSPSLKIKS